MDDIEPQTADGKVLLHFTMSLDGFVAGPDHDLSWMAGLAVRPGLLLDLGCRSISSTRPRSGIRLYDAPGGEPVRLHRLGTDAPTSGVSIRCCPAAR
jgi:hypothetical protein